MFTKGLLRILATVGLVAAGMAPAVARKSAIDAQLNRLSATMDGRNMAQATRDLDLFLLDERGNEISQDTSTGDIPIVNARPRWTGRFTLRVLMEDCKVNPCNHGVRFFAPK